MTGSVERVRLVTSQLLRQNRILLALLVLWPCAFSGILLAADRKNVAVEDVTAVLQQELFYGLVLTALGASAALGTEQKARRVQQVLGRAVGRSEYLLALGASVFLPFTGYLLVWMGNAGLFAAVLHLHAPMLFSAALVEFGCGLLLCAAGVLFSVLLPQTLAAIANGVVLAALTLAGTHGVGGAAGLFTVATGNLTTPRHALSVGLGEALLAAGALAGLAALLFTCKDLKQL